MATDTMGSYHGRPVHVFAGSHPDDLMRAACPLCARRHGLRRSAAVIHGQGEQSLTCKYSGRKGTTSQFPS